MALKTFIESNILTPIFNTININTEYIYNDFEFNESVPLSSIYCPIITVLLYCIGIPTLQHIMKKYASPNFKKILLIHNLFLSIISGFMFITLISVLLNFKYNNNYLYSNFQIYCGLTHFDQKGLLTFIYYINYLLKYYELIDTIFLGLKKKNISFLHAYHHPATLVLTWGQLNDSTGVQWVVILLNLFVHFIMYFYYFLSSLKIKFPFPQIITILQILQFIIDLIACYIAWYHVALGRGCYGRNRSGFIGCFILTSYLYLFVDFYMERYNKKNLKIKAQKKLEKKVIKKIE